MIPVVELTHESLEHESLEHESLEPIRQQIEVNEYTMLMQHLGFEA